MLATLAADGGVSVPVNGPRPSTAQVWSNQTLHNFIRELQGNQYSADMRGAVGGALYDSLLQKLHPPPGRDQESVKLPFNDSMMQSQLR